MIEQPGYVTVNESIKIQPGVAYPLSELFNYTPGTVNSFDFERLEIYLDLSSTPTYTVSGGEILDQEFVDTYWEAASPLYASFDVQSPVSAVSITFAPNATGDYTLYYIWQYLYDVPTGGGYAINYYYSATAIFNGTGVTLFTTGRDTVDFDNLTSAQQAAAAAGANLYNGLGGDDVVTLPNVGSYQLTSSVTWDPTQTFATGSLAGDTYTVNGGNGSYKIALGAGSDTVDINGNGSSVITCGSGNDTININGNGNNSIIIGGGAQIQYRFQELETIQFRMGLGRAA